MGLNDRKITVYANPVANLPDHPSQEGFTAERLKAAFDAIANEEVKHAINGIIDDLISKIDGASGADQVGSTGITDLDGTTVQAILESLRNKLKSVTDGTSGADFIGATGISNLDGTTVQAILESLRNKLKSTTDNSSGADFIGATALKEGGATTVQGQLEELSNNIVTVNNNEALRILQETARNVAETARASAEAIRKNSEDNRVAAEANREIAEQERVDADILRGQTVEAIEQNYAPRLTAAEESINSLDADLKFGGVITAPPVTHQSIPNEVMTKVIFSRIIKQEKYVFFNIEEPTKIKIPPGISKVKIMASATWLNNAVGVRHISVEKNGSPIVGNGGISSIPAHNNAIANQASPVRLGTTVIDVVENDYFEFLVWQNSGGATTLIGTGAWFYLEVVE